MASTRDRLVEAAAGLLDEGGVPAVTLREVGRRAGVSHNAPYKHFAGKEELLAAVAAAQLRRNRESALRISRGHPLRQPSGSCSDLIDDLFTQLAAT
jgi:AcrR family transcriptional regulator